MPPGSHRLMQTANRLPQPMDASLSSLPERLDAFAALSHKQGFLLWIGFLLNLLGEFLESLNGIHLPCIQPCRQVLCRTRC